MFFKKQVTFDVLVKSHKTVTPVNTLKGTSKGVQNTLKSLDVAYASENTHFRGNDKTTEIRLFTSASLLGI